MTMTKQELIERVYKSRGLSNGLTKKAVRQALIHAVDFSHKFPLESLFADISQTIPKSGEIVPPSHRQQNGISSAAN